MNNADNNQTPTPEDRLIASLQRRGFVEGMSSKWGLALDPYLAAGNDPLHMPQYHNDASTRQKRLIACAYATPSLGSGLCASWVEQCFSRLGYGVVLGDATSLYNDYCHYTDLADLKVGMIVATSAHPYSTSGLTHGHVGLYVGDNVVMDCADNDVRHVPLRLWLIAYGLMAIPRWGWLGSMGLT